MTISGYLGDLRRELNGRIPEAVATVRIREIESHLKLSMQAHAEFVSQHDAEVMAICDMGDAKVLAADLVRQHRGYSKMSAWRLTRWVGPAVLLGTVLPYAASMSVIRVHGSSSFEIVWTVFTSLALLAFVHQVWKTRRWLFVPVTAWVVCSLVFWIYIGSTVLTKTGAGQLKYAQKDLASLIDAKRAVEQWQHGRAPADKGPLIFSYTTTKLQTLFPITWHQAVQGARLSPMEGSQAASAWAEHGASLAANVARALPLAQQNLERAKVLHQDSMWALVWLDVRRGILPEAAYALIQLFVWNAATLGIAGVLSDVEITSSANRI